MSDSPDTPELPAASTPPGTGALGAKPLGRGIAWMGIALLAAWAAGRTWRAWADPLVDFGRELYVPWQVSEGAALHADLAWFQGPFSVWLNAILMRLFGAGMDRIFVANALWLLLALVTCGALVRRFCSAGVRDLAIAAWVGLLGFQQVGGIGNYNWLAPYSHELTHGISLSLVTLWFTTLSRERGSRWFAFLAGLTTGLVLLTKAEVVLALGLGLSPWLGNMLWKRRFDTGLAWLAGSTLPVIAATLWLARDLPLTEALEAVAAPYTHALDGRLHQLRYYVTGGGFERPGAHSLRAVTAAAWFLSLFLPAWIIERWAPRRRPRTALLLAALSPLATASWTWSLARQGVVGEPFFLPLLCVAAALLAVFGYRSFPSSAAARLSFTLFALGLLFKILLATRLSGYGFALGAPALVLAVVFTLHDVPHLLHGRQRSRLAFGWLGGAAVWLTLGYLYWDLNDHSRRFQKYAIGEGADRLVCDGRARYIEPALADLRERLEPGEPFLVLPEGIMLNYLMRSPSPSRHQNFMPPEFLMFGDETITEDLQSASPRVIVVAHKDTREYGPHPFGEAYAFDIGQWLRAEYEIVATYGAPPLSDQGFGIAILERR